MSEQVRYITNEGCVLLDNSRVNWRTAIISNSDIEAIEIVEQEIDDPSIQVGSGCQWNGCGVEPQWNNPKCSKVYDHILRHHGPQLQPRHFQGRIASTNTDQGQWLNLRDLVKAEQVTLKHPGRYIIDF